ncbi:MAG TPA: DUF4093 domain-containing protein [Candidatus Ornithomonoglobus intestinigallinarum]|uniref:DUF4093 domain-containing protein n=1 Tax=Candidatus Ornithomonoglobus intestinigallinarum TaxID=2840894 RepID=A0A9D1H0U3_9FIRM|nr:DUF4093 domain-containing protein [Candidatus Ornithomonoglobus intestinigallinarum]
MYRVKETIIVEGTYDKIKLSGFIDGIILTTGGFAVFKNGALRESIKELAERTGIVILTDSDAAGFKIRNFIKQSVPEKYIKHAYIPDISGKEKRKREPGKEGLLGVEGMSEEIIIDALKKAGCTIDGSSAAPKADRAVTKADLMKYGLAGSGSSAEKRRAFAHKLKLPARLSSNMLLDIINRLLTFEEFKRLAEEISEQTPEI